MSQQRVFRKQIAEAFDTEELKNICFDLSINYDNLPGDRLESKIRALLIDLFKIGKIADLYEILTTDSERTHIKWPPLVEIENFSWDNLETFSQKSADSLGQGFIALAQLVKVGDIRDSVLFFQNDIELVSQKLSLISFFKKLHDVFQDIETSHNLLRTDRERLPQNQAAWDDLMVNEFSLSDDLDQLFQLIETPPASITLGSWVKLLEKAKSDIGEAIVAQELTQLDKGLSYLFRALDKGLPRLNGRLISAAEDLPLDKLVSNLSAVATQASAQQSLDRPIVLQFDEGVDAMQSLADTLSHLIDSHNKWQGLDDDLRRIHSNLQDDIFELEIAWPDVQEMLVVLVDVYDEPWAKSLSRLAKIVTDSIDTKPVPTVKNFYHKFRGQATRRFRQVDDELLKLSRDLEQIGQPINTLLGAI
jgi:hypothetical protein